MRPEVNRLSKLRRPFGIWTNRNLCSVAIGVFLNEEVSPDLRSNSENCVYLVNAKWYIYFYSPQCRYPAEEQYEDEERDA